MKTLVLPVLNGILPKQNGRVKGFFVDPFSITVLNYVGVGGLTLLCPYVSEREEIYRVGMLARIIDLEVQRVYWEEVGGDKKALVATALGLERARASSLAVEKGVLIAEDVEPIDLKSLRCKGYPAICGAGWRVTGGSTEMKSPRDLRIRINGISCEDGSNLGLEAQVGGKVSPELAHSVEHAIVRSLEEYAICTPKTLLECLGEETKELKSSLEYGFRFRIPEVFGVTKAGFCGNPLTNLAQAYIAQGVIKGVTQGSSFARSLMDARRTTLSRLAAEFAVSTDAGVRAVQALKKGMLHDDSPIDRKKAEAILFAFPPDPWA